MLPVKYIGILLFFLLLITQNTARAQELQKYQFSLLRQDDRLDELIAGTQKSRYDRLKVIEFGNNQVISFGGSYRGQYELFRNEEFSFSPNRENGWYLQRILAHTNIELSKSFRIFGELGSSLISGKEDLAPVDRDELYVNQLFAELKFDNLTITMGRENLKAGSRRLLDPREGPNVRQAFDHLSFEWAKKDWSVLVFGGSPMIPRNGIFDNQGFQNEEWLWGVYSSKKLKEGRGFDTYYLGFHQEEATYKLGTDEELRNSLGFRIWDSKGRWQYDNEAVWQFGSFGETNLFAWTVSFNIKNKLNKNNQLGLKTELISGTTSAGRLGTFNPLYPRGAYFGRVARFGPANLIDIHPYWTFRKKRFTMEIDYDVFWRFSLEDAVYGPPLNIALDGDSDERFIAQQIGTIFNYEFNPFAVVELETNVIFPGEYIREVRPDSETLLHVVFTSEFRF
ncbi:MAG: alginate export family protein [Bacteroidota bacterium]